MGKYLIEFIGTFFLTFTVANVVLGDVGVLGPLAIAGVLMALIYAGGHISGAHYNPAVTLGVLLRGKCPAADVVPYVVAQVGAAVVAGIAAMWLHGSGAAADTMLALKDSMPKVMLVEFIATFALVFTVLNVATAASTSGNSFYGFAIGLTVLVGAITVGGISGGAFNPAVSVLLGVIKKLAWPEVWMHLAPQLAAGAVAAILFKVCYGIDNDD